MSGRPPIDWTALHAHSHMYGKVAPWPLPRGQGNGIKPAMAGQRDNALPTNPGGPAVPAAPAGQGRRPVDPSKLPRPLPQVLGIKLTPELRSAIAEAAKKEGLSDSAWLRALALRTLGLDSPADAVTGPRPRIPSEHLVALTACLQAMTAAHAPLSDAPEKIRAAVKEHLAVARKALIPVLTGEAGRVS